MILATLKALAGSKKFLSALAGVLALVGVRYLGLEEAASHDLSQQIMVVVSALLLGQGAADLGKEGKGREADGMLALASTAAAFGDGDEEDGV